MDTPGLPGAMRALWGAEVTARPGPRPRLSVRSIAEAAVEIADADGLAAVSMARVADRLGVTPMALYRYVASKDELLAVMSDVGVPHPPDTDPQGPWREQLERWALGQLDIARARPWLVELLVSPGTATLGPSRLAWIERGLAALAGTGLPEPLKVGIIGTLSLHMVTEGQVYAAEEQARAAIPTEPMPQGDADAAEHLDAAHDAPPVQHVALLDWSAMLAQVVDPTTQPHLARALAAHAFADDGSDSQEGHGNLAVAMLLDGVAALIERFGAPAAAGDAHADAAVDRRADGDPPGARPHTG